MSRESSPVLYVKDGAVAVVSLNRPRQLNAYNMAMRDALYAALEAVRDDPEVRVMILRGNGPSFCTGGDLTEFGSAASAVAARDARWRRDVWGLLYGLGKPTIAMVHGYVVGGGLEMALLCDLCLAASDARFFYPETGLAMIPGVAGTQTTPRLAGRGRALDLVLTGREITASQALEWNLVARVVSADELEATAMKLARSAAKLSPDLTRRLKRAVNEGLDLNLEDGLRLESRLAAIDRMEHSA
jgi:enoyl-CoA hydratase/carnithine racemase